MERYSIPHILNILGVKAFNSPVSLRLRALTGVFPPREIRPRSPLSSISDLFVWRTGDAWDTGFSLFNQLTHLFPERAEVDRVSFIVFDKFGKVIARKNEEVPPYKRRFLSISDVLSGVTHCDFGTVAFFHDVTGIKELPAARSHLTERGYIAYRKSSTPVWSYMHGNLQALCKDPGASSYKFVAGSSSALMRYRPQLRFDDCEKFELAYTNPTPRAKRLCVRLFDKDGETVKEIFRKIPSCGAEMIRVDNSDRRIVMIEGEGRIPMWRPAVFKYAQQSFDVFHG
ncbi:hypothetical protein [Thalassospira lucentensis]|uniref:hypothetical protein n=1 Tax=Thalassospira lucentensis TaxID=168935 RepID=UPI003D2D932E